MSLALNENTREHVASILQDLLTDAIDLALNLKQAHWNIRGPQFRALHLHLDEADTQVREIADGLAERMVALDMPADGRARTVADDSSLAPFPPGLISCEEAIRHLVDQFDGAIAASRKARERLSEIDAVSEDLVIQGLHVLEKQRWMLAAQLEHTRSS